MNPSRGVAVKGILVFWKAAPFAGRRWNEGLGRSVAFRGFSSRGRRRADDSGCPKDAEEGNAVSMRDKAHAPDAGTRDRCMSPGDASFARSFDPCTLILTMLRRRKPSEVGRSIRHHGWASSGNREEPTLGPGRANGARLAACHRFRKGEGVTRRRKGRRSRSPSLRGLKSSGLVARTS